MNHVNTSLLLGLAGAALFAIATSGWLDYSKRTEQQPGSEPLIPGLSEHINDVKAVSLIGAENKPLVSLHNDGNGWTVGEQGNYPADTGKLRGLLLDLANTKLLQSKTSKAEHYGELGVEDMAGKQAKGLLIRLEGLVEPANIIVGQASNHGGSFVRRPEQAQSWLTSMRLTVDRDPQHWLNPVLTDIAAQRIAEVGLTAADGKTLRVFKNKAEDSSFLVADLPQGRELMSPTIADPLAAALSNLQLEEVMPASPIPQHASKARYRSFDGLIVEATLWQQDGKHLAQLQATAEATATDPAIQSAVQQLQQRFQGRQFVIPAAKYVLMVKTQAELLKPLANQAEPAKPATAKAQAKNSK